jgi:formate hydrogenlyase subunit 3/multisubunit Na+/H+ antiporter MnhD subunit
MSAGLPLVPGAWLLFAALLLPWLLLPLLAARRLVAPALLLAPVPLLLLGVLALVGETPLDAALPRLLLGMRFVVDDVNAPLLLLAGTGWLLAGGYAADTLVHARTRFALFWLLTLAGQALAFLAADLAGFYAGYALMTLAAYGLVVHTGRRAAWRAGRVYLVLSLAGEMLVLAGVLLLAAGLGNSGFATLQLLPPTAFGLAPLLLFAGFSVKLGVVPLHVWLPLAHPVAPVPASAVLSGLLVKAGLLGMLRLLPPGSLPPGDWLLLLGLVTAGWGALVGLTQTRLKTVLAYSTISQMGLALAGFAALHESVGHPGAVAALGLFALHHGLNKIALFLAAGHRLRTRLDHALFLLPALALAGLPLTAGALAKSALKGVYADALLDAWLLALSFSSVLTTLLLLHAWRLLRDHDEGRTTPHAAWVASVVAGLALPWAYLPAPPDLAGIWAGLWPLLAGVGIHGLAKRYRHRLPRRPRIPEGDIVVPGGWLPTAATRTAGRVGERWRAWRPRLADRLPKAEPLRRLESRLQQVPATGLALLGLLLACWGLLRVD